MEEKTLSPLRNERVIIRRLLKEGKITNPKHVLYGGMALGAFHTFTVPMLRNGQLVDVLTKEEKLEWIAQHTKVALGSDAFFPFGDNIERAHKSGVEFIAQAGGSVRDDQLIMTCDKYGIAMAFTGVRLFHH